jgi:hypothetical protein
MITFTKKTMLNKYTQDIGGSENTSFRVVHNLGTRDVVVSMYDLETGQTGMSDIVYLQVQQPLTYLTRKV